MKISFRLKLSKLVNVTQLVLGLTMEKINSVQNEKKETFCSSFSCFMHEASLKYDHELVRKEICCFSVSPISSCSDACSELGNVRGRKNFWLARICCFPVSSSCFFEITTEKEFFTQLRGRPKLLVKSFIFSVWRSSLSINFYGTSFHAGPYPEGKVYLFTRTSRK